MRFILIFSLLFFSFRLIPLAEKSPDAEFAEMINDYVNSHYKKYNINEYIYVSVKYQQLYLIRDTMIVMSFPISTAKNGTGSKINSKKTPLGLHRITHLIGDEVPAGGVIGPGGYTGKTTTILSAPETSGKDEVTTRALRLEGMEPGKNKGGDNDSFVREIYIHGTPEEGLIGTPVSHGCVRMRNNDVIELYKEATKGLYVLILQY